MVVHIPNIIIGGGIAGLHIAYQLHCKNEPFFLLESSDRLGGRIYTIDSNYELGASIFHSNQKNLINFINNLGLKNEVQKVDSKWKLLRVCQGYTLEEANKIFKELKHRVKNSVQKNSKTLDEHCKNVLTVQEYNVLKTCWPAWYETYNMNAYTYFESSKHEGEYLKMKNGLNKIYEKCNELFGSLIKLNCKVQSVICGQKYYIQITNKKINTFQDSLQSQELQDGKITCDMLYLCTSLKATQEIQFQNCLQLSKYLSKCNYQSCFRFYVKFKNPILNTVDWTSICGDTKTKWIIKLDNYTILGPYVDSVQANYMKDKTEKEILMYIIDDLIDHNVKVSESDIEACIGAYWEDGIEILSPSFYETNQNLFHISDTFKCTILPKPIDQGWMNGNLYLHSRSD